MKNKYISSLLILLLIAVVAFMGYDLFFSSKTETNPYEYNISDLKKVDTALVGYTEVLSFAIPLDDVCGIAVDQYDNIYVSGQKQIIVFDSEGQKFASYNTNEHPYCIAVKDSFIYMGAGNHIEVLHQKDKTIKKWPLIHDSTYITSIALKENIVFVADAGGRMAYAFDTNGKLTDSIGGKNKNRPKGFILPSPYFDMAINQNDELWIVNPGMHQLENYSDKGRFVSSWKKPSMQIDGFSGCCNPSHIAFLKDGSFVTSEKGLVRVKVHRPTGEFKTVVATPNQFDAKTTGLDLAVDSRDRILVLDTKRLEVRIFTNKTHLRP